MRSRESIRLLTPVWLIFVVYGLVAADCQEDEQPTPFAPTAPQFLARNVNTNARAVEYYQSIGVIDPNDPTKPGPKATLARWKQANNFIPGVSEVSATYFNEADLRFGREMHCVSYGDFYLYTRIACYVIPTDEELMIARHALQVLRSHDATSPKEKSA